MRHQFGVGVNLALMPLSHIPSTFGLTELKKGFSPHLFNTKENQCYVGPLPDAKYFGPSKMKSAQRMEFDKWYITQKDQPFDFRKEITEYCRSDVDILMKGYMTMRNIFMDITNIDPFHQITITPVLNSPETCLMSNFISQNTYQ